MNICVYGAASNKIDKEYINAVILLGQKMAKRGHNLVFGAGGTGLMGAIARGVSEGGGKIKGVIPTFFIERDVEVISKYCDEVVYTEDMRDRKEEMENSADAFIVVPGGIGTFEEFFEILTLKQLERHNKPIAVYNFADYYKELNAMMEASIEKQFINEACRTLYTTFDDMDAMLDFIENDRGTNFGIDELKK